MPLHTLQTAAHHRSANPTQSSIPGKGSGSRQLAPPPSAHHGFIRCAIALHKPASSGQHRFPVCCGPIAGPCPYAYEQEHEESQGTDNAVRYDPLFTQSPAAEREENILPMFARRVRVTVCDRANTPPPPKNNKQTTRQEKKKELKQESRMCENESEERRPSFLLERDQSEIRSLT